MDEWIEILVIMKKYQGQYNKDRPFWAEHDVIGLFLDLKDVSKADIEHLYELGAFYSDEYNSLIKFV